MQTDSCYFEISSADKPWVVNMRLACLSMLCNCLVTFVFTACWYMLVIYHDRMANSSKQDSYRIGQDGKYNRQAIAIHDRTVSRWVEPQSGYRVAEGW